MKQALSIPTLDKECLEMKTKEVINIDIKC